MKGKGFTLIELMLAILLVTGLFWVGLTNLKSTFNNQTLEAATNGLRQTLILAKNNALQGKKDCQVCGAAGPTYRCGSGDVPLQGWEVSMAANTYLIAGICTNNGNLASPTRFSVRTTKLPDGMTLAATSPTVVFRPNQGGVYIIPATTTNTITLTLAVSGYTKSMTIIVEDDGEVR